MNSKTYVNIFCRIIENANEKNSIKIMKKKVQKGNNLKDTDSKKISPF